MYSYALSFRICMQKCIEDAIHELLKFILLSSMLLLCCFCLTYLIHLSFHLRLSLTSSQFIITLAIMCRNREMCPPCTPPTLSLTYPALFSPQSYFQIHRTLLLNVLGMVLGCLQPLSAFSCFTNHLIHIV